MEDGNQQDRELRAARNQSLFRAVNEKLRGVNEAFSDFSDSYAIACECADTTCVETLQIPMQDYLDVREHPDRFVVLAAHIVADVERVVSSSNGYVVVEKNAPVSLIPEAQERQP